MVLLPSSGPWPLSPLYPSPDTALKPTSHATCLILSVLRKLRYCQQLWPQQQFLPPTRGFLRTGISLLCKCVIPPPGLQTHPSAQVLCFIINLPSQQLPSLSTVSFSSAHKPVQDSSKTKPSFHSTSDHPCPSISSYYTPLPHPYSPVIPSSVPTIPLKLLSTMT